MLIIEGSVQKKNRTTLIAMIFTNKLFIHIVKKDHCIWRKAHASATFTTSGALFY